MSIKTWHLRCQCFRIVFPFTTKRTVKGISKWFAFAGHMEGRSGVRRRGKRNAGTCPFNGYFPMRVSQQQMLIGSSFNERSTHGVLFGWFPQEVISSLV